MSQPSLYDIQRDAFLARFNRKCMTQRFWLAQTIHDPGVAHNDLHKLPRCCSAPGPNPTLLTRCVSGQKGKQTPRYRNSAEHAGATLLERLEDDRFVSCINSCDGKRQNLRDPSARERKDQAEGSRNDAFIMEGTGQYVHIPFRIDSGEVQEVVSKTNYSNTADAVFSYEMADAPPRDILATGFGSLFGLGPKDLRAFLHAREVRFELPLAGSSPEVVSVFPQDGSFQQFLSACNINLSAIDEDAAKQARAAERASGSASDDGTDHPDAAMSAARAQDEADVRTSCISGQGPLRILTDKPLKPVGFVFGTADLRVYNGLVVAPVANADAVAQGYCEVQFSRLDKQIRGEVALADVQPFDSKVLALQNAR